VPCHVSNGGDGVGSGDGHADAGAGLEVSGKEHFVHMLRFEEGGKEITKGYTVWRYRK